MIKVYIHVNRPTPVPVNSICSRSDEKNVHLSAVCYIQPYKIYFFK